MSSNEEDNSQKRVEILVHHAEIVGTALIQGYGGERDGSYDILVSFVMEEDGHIVNMCFPAAQLPDVISGLVTIRESYNEHR